MKLRYRVWLYTLLFVTIGVLLDLFVWHNPSNQIGLKAISVSMFGLVLPLAFWKEMGRDDSN